LSLRDFSRVPYVPLLTVRPAELRALQELPARDKDLLLPYFFLRPWAAAHQLSAATDKVRAAYGDRPLFMDLAEEEFIEAPRPVHDQLAALRSPENGYANWCEFIERTANFIPTMQVAEPLQFEAQARRLIGLDRGLAVRFPRAAFQLVGQYCQELGRVAPGGQDVLIVLDYGKGNRDLLTQEAVAVGLIRTIIAALPQATISITASSFPDGFVAITSQEIYERRLFNGVREQLAGVRVVYSDRGSARAERQLGGGGAPAPRIDYARPLEWNFFRSEADGNRPAAYRSLANTVMRSDIWDAGLRLWGTQMIERTALGDPEAITSPVRSTAARINIHLHRQLFYDDPAGLYDTDEDWSD
jgi:hypothetical protein